MTCRLYGPLRRAPWLLPVALLVLLVPAARGETQGEPGPALTLETALAMAEQRNLGLQAVREEKEVARGQIGEARSSALPHVDLSAQYARVDDVARFGEGETAALLGQKDNYQAMAEVSQVVYAGGGVRAALRLARAHDAGVDGRIGHSRSLLVYQVHALFNQILLAAENVGVARQAVDLSEQNLHDVQAQLKQGVATRFDVLRAEEQVSRGRSELLAADSSHRKARLALLRLLDLPLDDPRPIEGALSFELLVTVDSNSVAQAMAHRLDLAEATAAVAAQREGVSVAKSAGRPTVALFGEAKYANPDRSFADEWETSWMAGARVEFPLFDGAAARAQVGRADARFRQAGLQRRDLAADIRLQVAAAIVDIEAAARQVEARQGNVVQAEEALRLARRGYEAGVQQQVDVLTAQLAFTDSRRSYAAAVFEHTMAQRRLQFAMGTLVADTGPASSARDGELRTQQESDGAQGEQR